MGKKRGRNLQPIPVTIEEDTSQHKYESALDALRDSQPLLVELLATLADESAPKNIDPDTKSTLTKEQHRD